jgi:hypothetical protein
MPTPRCTYRTECRLPYACCGVELMIYDFLAEHSSDGYAGKWLACSFKKALRT